MSNMYRQTWAEINLDNLAYNYQKIKTLLGKKGVIPVLKGNGYGHGDVEVMKKLYDEGVRICAVALVEEALKLRAVFPDIIILLMGPVLKRDLEVCSLNKIDITIYNEEIYQDILDSNFFLYCQFKVDTGMSRYGIKNINKIVEMVNTLMNKENILLRGIYSHFATAEDNEEFLQSQVEIMKSVLGKLKKIPSMVHISNSASILKNEASFDFTTHARVGICLYGALPIIVDFKLKPVMKLCSKIVDIKKLVPGEALGYGITYQPEKNEYIAIVPIGYVDGLKKSFRNTNVEINKNKYKIVGTICMDACFIRVDEAACIGDIVTFFGGIISVESVASILETNNSDILSAISYRVPRIYISDEILK